MHAAYRYNNNACSNSDAAAAVEVSGASYMMATTPVAPLSAAGGDGRRNGFVHRHSPSMPDLGAAAMASALAAAGSAEDGCEAVASPLDAFRSKHGRSGSTNSNSSDVQGIVARFNRLEIRDREREREKEREREREREKEREGGFATSVNGSYAFGERSIFEKSRGAREDSLALKRAEMARDVAEGDARRAKEEVRRLKEELESAITRSREEARKVRKETEITRDREQRVYKRLEVIIVSNRAPALLGFHLFLSLLCLALGCSF